MSKFEDSDPILLLSSDDEDENQQNSKIEKRERSIQPYTSRKRHRQQSDHASFTLQNANTRCTTQVQNPEITVVDLTNECYSNDSEINGRHFVQCNVQTDKDNSMIVTDGWNQYLPLLNNSTTNDIHLLCNPKMEKIGNTNDNNVPCILHCQQKDKWSCGYRNLQMVLSVMLPLLPKNHPYFQTQVHLEVNAQSKVEFDAYLEYRNHDSIIIPSIHQIQLEMEKSWKHQFDPNGAQHYRNKIHQTRKKIGAVEVASLLSFWYFDTTVLQFARTKESRKYLGPFVWEYFSSSSLYNNNSTNDIKAVDNSFDDKVNDCDNGTSFVRASKLLSYIFHEKEMISNRTSHLAQKTCRKNEGLGNFPLYLQWEGHSVTIIGVEKVMNDNIREDASDSLHKASINLLVFDPLKPMSKFIRTETSTKEQHVSKSFDAGAILEIMRLPVTTLIRKDCQIIFPSIKPMEEIERLRHRRIAQTISVGL